MRTSPPSATVAARASPAPDDSGRIWNREVIPLPPRKLIVDKLGRGPPAGKTAIHPSLGGRTVWTLTATARAPRGIPHVPYAAASTRSGGAPETSGSLHRVSSSRQGRMG